MEFQIFKDASKKVNPYYWCFATKRGDVRIRSDGYASFDDCYDTIQFLAINAFSAQIRDLTDEE